MKPWQSGQIQGIVRFRDRVWNVCSRATDASVDEETNRLLHKTVKKLTHDYEALSFNTAISALMVLTNHLGALAEVPKAAAETLALLIAPMAPHLGEELWKSFGHPASLAYAAWPSYDEALTVDDVIELPVQVNGKVRGRVMLSRTASEADAKTAAMGAEGVPLFTDGKTVKKFIYVPGKIVNLVVG